MTRGFAGSYGHYLPVAIRRGGYSTTSIDSKVGHEPHSQRVMVDVSTHLGHRLFRSTKEILAKANCQDRKSAGTKPEPQEVRIVVVPR